MEKRNQLRRNGEGDIVRGKHWRESRAWETGENQVEQDTERGMLT